MTGSITTPFTQCAKTEDHYLGTPRKHGHTRGRLMSPTYQSWNCMIQRCTNPRRQFWDRYGGRGIKVCDRWASSFKNFLADMGERPAGMTLDRFPNRDGDYGPGNCRWATPAEQQANRAPFSRKPGLPRIDVSQQRFGRLVAIRFLHTAARRQSVWECQCDCGNTALVRLGNLRSGCTSSCGCRKRETIGELNTRNRHA